MVCSTVLSLIGLILDIAGVILLAFVATPAHTYTPDGSDNFTVVPDSEKAKENAKKYHQMLAWTRVSYIVILLGFVFQGVAYLL